MRNWRLRQRPGGAPSFGGVWDECLCTGFETAAFDEDAAAAGEAFDADIGAGAEDAEIEAAAGMRTAHAIDLAFADFGDGHG